MAYYNANRVIKLTRKALGLTQEKLSEGICEVETYSRIENGHHTIRRSTYQKLMEKMGRNTGRRYAICVSKDGMLLDEKIELERAFKRYDYEAAEKYLNILKEKVDDNLLTRQYMARAEALVEYYRKRIGAEELIQRLDEALKITVPEYERYLEENRVFPFSIMEILILVSMGNAYRHTAEWSKGILMYESVHRCLKMNYIGEPDNMSLQIIVGRNLARAYAESGNNIEALAIIEEGIEMALRFKYEYIIESLYVGKAFNIIELVNEGTSIDEGIEEAYKCLRQAYYLAAARGETEMMEHIKQFYNDCNNNN